MDVTILMRISAVKVPYWDNVVPENLKFDTSYSGSPFVVLLALMCSAVHSDIELFCGEFHAVHIWYLHPVISSCRYCSSLLLLSIKSMSSAKRCLQKT